MEDPELEWEETPSYYEFIKGVVNVSKLVLDHSTLKADATEPYWSFVRKNAVGLYGISILLGLAVALTYFRDKLTKKITQPLCKTYGLTETSQTKISESAWRMLFYTICWTWEFYLAVIKYRFFQRPSLLFSDQEQKEAVLWDIEMIYAVQVAFYLHATYTAFFVDVWRKDSNLLVFHHVLTILMLSFSYTNKLTELGLLVLLVHDCSDVFLEFCKINICLKEGVRRKVLFDNIATVSFLLFILTWFVSRLYLFPLRVIHAVSIALTERQMYKLHFLFTSYLMTLFLLIVNCYWTYLILKLLVKILTGRMTAVEDIRDYDVEDHEKGHDAIQNSYRKKKTF